MMFIRIKLCWHLIRHGHSIKVNRYITVPMYDLTSKGWLYECECGESWAR